MAELNLIQLDNEKRLEILNKLGYNIDEGGYIIDILTKKEVICKYGGEKVHINTVAILPGSLAIINANPVTMAEYFMDMDNQDEQL
ncbi:MAG: hypothetical protein KJ920_13080 [Actinobacteria bacterium]|nr:hypothetical protein [Actinomycetota bacterium]